MRCALALGGAVTALLLGPASLPARAAILVTPGAKPGVSAAEAQEPTQDRAPPVGDGTTSGPRRSARRSGAPLRWIVASHGGEVELVDTGQVRFFQSDSKYTRVATADRDLVIRKTIKELAATLDPAVFWQVHRSTIVNVAMVASVSHKADRKLVVHLRDRPELLHVSRPYAYRFHGM